MIALEHNVLEWLGHRNTIRSLFLALESVS
jgi:hypothetical protein